MAKGCYADLGDYRHRRAENEATEEAKYGYVDPVDYIREAHTARTEVDALRRLGHHAAVAAYWYRRGNLAEMGAALEQVAAEARTLGYYDGMGTHG